MTKILKIEKTTELIYTGSLDDIVFEGEDDVFLEEWKHNAEFRIFFDNGKCIHKPCTANPLEEQMLLRSLIRLLHAQDRNESVEKYLQESSS